MGMNEVGVGLEESYEKEILADVVMNYKEFRRIFRKTGCEIHLGELKSKLNNLYFKRALSAALMAESYSITNEILKLKVEFVNTLKMVKVSKEIEDIIFNVFENYMHDNGGSYLRKEVDKTNSLITVHILQILKSSIKYQLGIIENRISVGKLHFVEMKDTRLKYYKIFEKFENIKYETNNEAEKKLLEEVYDETLDIVYEADSAIKNSKWLNGPLNFD
jgi:hypothetical protein